MIATPFTPKSAITSILAVACLALTGCLERVEHITINAEGGVTLQCKFRGTPDDFKRSDDALPEPAAPWAVADTPGKNDKGEDEMTRAATLSIAPGGAFPESFASPKDPRAEFTLRFPSEVRLRRTAGRTFCDFSRTYLRRDEAPFTYVKRLLTRSSEGKRLLETDPTTLSDVDLNQAVSMLAGIAADKQAQCVAAAGRDMETRGLWTQEPALRIRAALLDTAQSLDRAPTIALLRQPPSPERNRAIAGIGPRFEATLDLTITNTLAAMQIPDPQRSLFYAGLTRARSMRAATDDLADERWEVRVSMPGEVVAHNADAVEGTDLVLRFTASAFEDRDHPLRATSVITK